MQGIQGRVIRTVKLVKLAVSTTTLPWKHCSCHKLKNSERHHVHSDHRSPRSRNHLKHPQWFGLVGLQSIKNVGPDVISKLFLFLWLKQIVRHCSHQWQADNSLCSSVSVSKNESNCEEDKFEDSKKVGLKLATAEFYFLTLIAVSGNERQKTNK